MGAGCSCSGKSNVQEPLKYDDDWCYVSSSDEECGVPPIPVGSDDGTVLFYWVGETPRTLGGNTPGEYDVTPGEYAVGDVLEYKHCMRVEVMEINDDTGSVLYTVRLPDGSYEHTVGHRLAAWKEDNECKSHTQLRANAAMETATGTLPLKRLPSLVNMEVPDAGSDTKEDCTPPADLGASGAAPGIADAGLGVAPKWSLNEGSANNSKDGKPKKKGLRFGSDQVHEIDNQRAANTHLSLEQPLNLPMVPPNTLQHGFHWENEMASVEEEAEVNSDDELEAELERQLEEA